MTPHLSESCRELVHHHSEDRRGPLICVEGLKMNKCCFKGKERKHADRQIEKVLQKTDLKSHFSESWRWQTSGARTHAAVFGGVRVMLFAMRTLDRGTGRTEKNNYWQSFTKTTYNIHLIIINQSFCFSKRHQNLSSCVKSLKLNISYRLSHKASVHSRAMPRSHVVSLLVCSMSFK